MNSFFTLPGQQDRNVAIAWAQWLLREDDQPHTVMDAIVNGFIGGALLGGSADAVGMVFLRRSRVHVPFVWARRFATIGCVFTVASHAARSRLPLAVESAQHHAASPTPAEHSMMRDPWAGEVEQPRQ